MSSRIIITVYAPTDSPKIGYAQRTLDNVLSHTDFVNNELFISDNGSCQEMLNYYAYFKEQFELSWNPENLTVCLNGKNLGTSGGVNMGIRGRKPNQFVIKRDDDTIIEDYNWVERMEECYNRFDNLGILGLKRNDLIQHPDHETEDYRTVIKYLKHERGDTWIPIELCKDIIGTCTMFSPQLLDRLGYSIQPSEYGFDDVLWSVRSSMAGFVNAFLPSIGIEHIDTGIGEFVLWKQRHAGEIMGEFSEMAQDYKIGVRDVYHNPYQ